LCFSEIWVANNKEVKLQLSGFSPILHNRLVMYLSLHRYNCQLYASLLRRPIYRFQWELEANCLYSDRPVSTLIPLQLKYRLWTTVVLFHCCALIWGLTNDNYGSGSIKIWSDPMYFNEFWMTNLRKYEHIIYENSDFMSQDWEKINQKLQ
jgi:hypothetical protein